MKIAIAQLNYHIGHFEKNFDKIKGAIANAVHIKADLVLFGELAVCGYPPRDFLEFEDFINNIGINIIRCSVITDVIIVIIVVIMIYIVSIVIIVVILIYVIIIIGTY